MKRGVIFCHGHEHPDIYSISRKLPQKTEWILVDKDPRVRPDLVGSFIDPGTFRQLGYNIYDYVYEIGCPFHHDYHLVIEFLRGAYNLLKEEGYVNIRGLLQDLMRQYDHRLYLPEYSLALEKRVNDYFRGQEPIYDEVFKNILIETNFKDYRVDNSPFMRDRGSVFFYKKLSWMKRGVIFCHGHEHPDIYSISRDLPRDAEWTYVDIDPDVQPDIVGDLRCPETFEQLGYNIYDYVYEIGCPFHHDYTLVLDFLRGAYNLLKEGGYVNIRGFLQDLMRQSNRQLLLDPSGIGEILNDYFRKGNPIYDHYDEFLNDILRVTHFKGYEVVDSPFMRDRGSVFFYK